MCIINIYKYIYANGISINKLQSISLYIYMCIVAHYK